MLVLAVLATVAGAPRAETVTPGTEPFRDMSLEDLLSVEVYTVAALTRLTPLESPAGITTITAEDIRLTPARNLNDLIEVYVPGALWMNQETGPVLGMRGNISSRNHRYLLLVDGRAMNNKSFAGASPELEMWDLGDIERIEVVRGPGSVTYGPGAVAGIISITTRKPGAAVGTAASVGYVDPYDSRSLTLSHQMKADAIALFAHASIVDTKGEEARTFQIDSSNHGGFVGRDYLPGSEALDYYGDFDDDPQLKLHVRLDFANDWQWWTRYTQQGSYWFSNEIKTDFGGELVNQQGTSSRQVTTAVQHDAIISDTLSLSAMLSFDSYDFERRRDRAYDPDRHSPLNYQVKFAEDEVLAHGVLEWQAAEWAQVALGAEWAHDRFGPGWGDDEREMRQGESGEIINGADSLALSPGNRNSADRQAPAWPAIHVGDGWDTNTTSFFVEANLAIVAGHKLLLSGRADQSTYQDWLYSPRAAWIWTLTERHVLKLIAQRASRMNTASQMYANDWHDLHNRPEELDSLELRYSAQSSPALGFDLSLFHNDSGVIAFQGADNSNRQVGDLELNGMEAEVHYAGARGRAGMSFSWVELQDWKLAPGVLSSGVSYSDYNLQIGGAAGGTQVGTGSDLNNWPNQSLKVFGNYQVGERLTLHVDARWYSEMRGAKDGLEGLGNALAGTPSATPDFHAAMGRVAREDAYDSDIRFNALLDFAVSPGSSLQLYGQNLFGGDGNKRYAYDESTKNGRAAPTRVRFVEESQSWGIRFIHRF